MLAGHSSPSAPHSLPAPRTPPPTAPQVTAASSESATAAPPPACPLNPPGPAPLPSGAAAPPVDARAVAPGPLTALPSAAGAQELWPKAAPEEPWHYALSKPFLPFIVAICLLGVFIVLVLVDVAQEKDPTRALARGVARAAVALVTLFFSSDLLALATSALPSLSFASLFDFLLHIQVYAVALRLFIQQERDPTSWAQATSSIACALTSYGVYIMLLAVVRGIAVFVLPARPPSVFSPRHPPPLPPTPHPYPRSPSYSSPSRGLSVRPWGPLQAWKLCSTSCATWRRLSHATWRTMSPARCSMPTSWRSACHFP